MIRNRLFVWILLILISFTRSFAQDYANEPCGTMAADAELRKKFPKLGSLDDFENQLQRKIAERKVLEKSGKIAAAVITIPVIVHIVHNGEAVGSGSNISEAQVTAQLKTLNDDFRNKNVPVNDNWASRRADIEIEFCTAIIGPDGKSLTEKGIHRLPGGRASWDRDAMENFKAQTIWDPDKYFNIWVFNIASTGATQLLGYAQFPYNSTLSGLGDNRPNANTDGVAIWYQAFGAGKRTLAHETGHWLGLRHIWGDATCGNDYCEDTPAQADASSGCPTGRQSCGSGNTNMVENYMDYTNDACMNIFTNDQKTRMRTVMDFADRRGTLLQSNVCGNVVAGPLTANFVADKVVTLLNTEIQFTDRSSGGPTSWEWTFQGGQPGTSKVQNPLITYAASGKFNVTLKITKDGVSHTVTKTQYIEVLSGGTCADETNFSGAPVLIRDGGGGYISGQNGRKISAISENFENRLGYTTLSGASIRFGKAFAKLGASSETVVNVVVWNARGYQGGPGSAIEIKAVPLRLIMADVASGRRTEITFDREVPLFGRGYHVGVEFDYAGDSLAVFTTRDGIKGTAWERDSKGEWDLYLKRNGLVVAHDIIARAGVKPSVSLSANKQFIYPGEAVTLQANGAAIYNWTPVTNLNTILGPQVVARPSKDITYKVKGSGIDMCLDSAVVTIFVRNVQVTGKEPDYAAQLAGQVSISPNPTNGYVEVSLKTSTQGLVNVVVYNVNGVVSLSKQYDKVSDEEKYALDIRNLPSGLYLVEIQLGEAKARKRIIKQ